MQKGDGWAYRQGARRQLASPRVLQWSASGRVAPRPSLLKSGSFAERFQAEARNGYSMLSMAQSILRGDSPITDAEARLRRAADLSDPPTDRV
jgi:hypothetical protein